MKENYERWDYLLCYPQEIWTKYHGFANKIITSSYKKSFPWKNSLSYRLWRKFFILSFEKILYLPSWKNFVSSYVWKKFFSLLYLQKCFTLYVNKKFFLPFYLGNILHLISRENFLSCISNKFFVVFFKNSLSDCDLIKFLILLYL